MILAGILQMIMGYAKAGFIAYFLPSSVIKGMLTGIGLLIILKQIPYALGYDNEVVGDLSDFQVDGETSFASISSAFHALILWETVLTKKHKVFELIQGPIIVVLFKQLYRLGSEQFVPFIATVTGILATDLLKGICIGLAFGIFYTLRHSYYNTYSMKDTSTRENEHAVHHLVLAEEVSFFNKAIIIQALDAIPPYSKVIIDCSNSKSIAYDVIEYLRDYKINAKLKNITVETIDFIESV
ncbi:TPA: SulP family inorganic anion transporter [Legionella feeleii]